jgi:hypothetical protein
MPADQGPAIPKTSGMAILSLVLGLVAVTTRVGFLAAILAIVFGGLALSRFGQDDAHFRGRGLATAGVTLGILTFILKPLGCILFPFCLLF